jgi:SET domain-containing protein
MQRRTNRPPFATRRSKIHGTGVFATRRIRPGQLLIAYLGQVITTAAARKRYGGKAANGSPTYLFHFEGDLYVDAAVDGNDARFINHSCDPNCDPEVLDGAIWIRSTRNIQPGVELAYDYALTLEKGSSREKKSRYTCRCGAVKCRGTMLDVRGSRGH